VQFNRNQQLAAIALLGLALIGLGFGFARPSLGRRDTRDMKITEPSQSTGQDVDISVDDNSPAPSSPSPAASIMVHVAGRVKFPNVYTLAPGNRVVDAIKAAGGSCADANLDAVNLAAKVKDGDKILVPSRNMPIQSFLASVAARAPRASAAAQPGSSEPSRASSSGKFTVPGQGVVNINTASPAELQQLPGVGPSTAQKIIDHRTEIGSFTSVDQLMDVKGIGPKKMEKMKPFVAL
jgi:competence protein ComEA